MRQDRPKRDEVGVDARVRLHVRVVGAKERLRMVGGQHLDLVHKLAARIEPMPGSALGVLVAEPVAHGQQYRRRGVVLRGDELELTALVAKFAANIRGNGGFDCLYNVECGAKRAGVWSCVTPRIVAS